ncbi:hypothetical protein [Pseudomonas japonica]|uniref:Lipoprotein n=1 Tax=Pseudomonas japonica TaxID=256466 RepID=A0A239BRS4_9PSED|nr:hypothetical protein [Pseudomonas japonica]SNS10707.1 hypothetical protein SAMN05444352_103164 [Pseudomonas japonica]
MKQYVVISLAAVVLSGCLDKSEQNAALATSINAIASMEVNKKSPDMAVKSWWRLKDAGAAMFVEACKNYVSMQGPYLDKLSELSTPDIYSDPSCSETADAFDRQITKVDVQSDTRAVVMAQIRNTTPPEAGAELTGDDRKRKEAGEAFQYVLERSDSKADWKISEVSTRSSWAGDWDRIFQKPTPVSNSWVYNAQQ